MYCVKCKKRTETTNERLATSKNGKRMKQGTCVVCGKTKTQFVKATEWGSLLNKIIIYPSRCIYRAIISRGRERN